jgi:hypothetical protein
LGAIAFLHAPEWLIFGSPWLLNGREQQEKGAAVSGDPLKPRRNTAADGPSAITDSRQ